MSRVFFLGCNHDQIPYLLAAKKLGFKVIGTDMNPDAPGSRVADVFYPVGYRDLTGLRKVAERENGFERDRVFTAAAHFAYEGASFLADALGIPFIRPEVVDICLDKTKFHSLLEKKGFSVPPTWEFDLESKDPLDPEKVYYLKSDYGKTPRYCYRITRGEIPALPPAFDVFYRRTFLLQEEITGSHFRVNLYHDQVSVFYKFSDTASAPMRFMGVGHGAFVEKLKCLVAELELNGYLTKFDIIVNEENGYVIDIGLDPPMRLKLLSDHLNIDFASAYTRYYLHNDPRNLPLWRDICVPKILHGSPNKGFSFLDLEN